MGDAEYKHIAKKLHESIRDWKKLNARPDKSGRVKIFTPMGLLGGVEKSVPLRQVQAYQLLAAEGFRSDLMVWALKIAGFDESSLFRIQGFTVYEKSIAVAMLELGEKAPISDLITLHAWLADGVISNLLIMYAETNDLASADPMVVMLNRWNEKNELQAFRKRQAETEKRLKSFINQKVTEADAALIDSEGKRLMTEGKHSRWRAAGLIRSKLSVDVTQKTVEGYLKSFWKVNSD